MDTNNWGQQSPTDGGSSYIDIDTFITREFGHIEKELVSSLGKLEQKFDLKTDFLEKEIQDLKDALNQHINSEQERQEKAEDRKHNWKIAWVSVVLSVGIATLIQWILNYFF